MFRAYRDLDVWQKSMRMVTQTYALIEGFPKQEQYSLTSQIRRSAVSVPSNIAEGKCRVSQKEFLRHLDIGHASLAELESTSEIARMLNGLSSAISQKLTASLSPLPATLEIA